MLAHIGEHETVELTGTEALLPRRRRRRPFRLLLAALPAHHREAVGSLASAVAPSLGAFELAGIDQPREVLPGGAAGDADRVGDLIDDRLSFSLTKATIRRSTSFRFSLMPLLLLL